MLKRTFSWIISNADTLIALVIAILASILSLIGKVSSSLVTNAIVATLAVIAFIMLHDRKSRRDAMRVITRLEDNITARNPIRVSTGKEINRSVQEAYRDTNRWYYRGPTGTYTRAVILPHCIERARQRHEPFEVRMEIIDPTSSAACHRHNSLYQNLAERASEAEMRRTVREVQKELYATIVSACWHMQQYDRFTARIGLSENVSTFRWEESSEYFLLTCRESRFPAMVIEKRDPFYGLLSTELELSFRQAREVSLAPALTTDMKMSYDPTVSEVRNILSKIHLALPAEFEESDVSQIIVMALHGRNRYSESGS